MSASRIEFKVGLFVLAALAFAAFLILKFSKGSSLFESTYEFNLKTSNVGGIREDAAVLMAGVRIGSVKDVQLDGGGRTATIVVSIREGNTVFSHSRFIIDQAGFLGDQYISITPLANPGPPIEPGVTVPCEPPFNFQEVARSGAGLLDQVEDTASKLDEAVVRINQSILAEETLTNLTVTVRNFRLLSERALATFRGVDMLVNTNVESLGLTISNMMVFSDRLNEVADELQDIIATNRFNFTATIGNIESASASFERLLANAEAGRGLAGRLLRDEELERSFRDAINHLSVLSSNLNKFGLLWKPPRERPSLPGPLYRGRIPLN